MIVVVIGSVVPRRDAKRDKLDARANSFALAFGPYVHSVEDGSECHLASEAQISARDRRTHQFHASGQKGFRILQPISFCVESEHVSCHRRLGTEIRLGLGHLSCESSSKEE